MTLAARVDHATAAHEVDLPLRYTELLVFGNPRAGTPLMQAAQKIAIDLPLKALVWSDAAGHTWVSYREPQWLARLYGLGDDTSTQVSAMSAALERLMAEVTGALPAARVPNGSSVSGSIRSVSAIAPRVVEPRARE
jgi:uncharacterized protein (DUF302 family)